MNTRILTFDPKYQSAVIQHILEIDNGEFDLNLSLEDQPDLTDINKAYIKPGGNFWVAVDQNDTVIGTIGVCNMENGLGYLRKMFVKPAYRGSKVGLSKALLEVLLDWCLQQGFKRIYLETTKEFVAAKKFYEKNGFEEIDRSEWPPSFPIIRVAKYFFVRRLR